MALVWWIFFTAVIRVMLQMAIARVRTLTAVASNVGINLCCILGAYLWLHIQETRS